MDKQIGSVKTRFRLAVLAAAPLLLVACGGGGGSDGSPSAAAPSNASASGPSGPSAAAGGNPASASGAGASPDGASGTPGAEGAPAMGDGTAVGSVPGAADSTVDSRFDPVRVGAASTEMAPAIARLSGGKNVVVWRADGQLLGRFIDAGGNLLGEAFVVDASDGRDVAVTALSDGGFLAAWGGTAGGTAGSTAERVQLRRFTADGQAVWSSQATDGGWQRVHSIRLAATADGGTAVAWLGTFARFVPQTAYFQRIGAAGERVGSTVELQASAATQAAAISVDIAALTDGSVLAAWVQTTTTNTPAVHTQHFSADSQPLRGPVQLAGSDAAERVSTLALANGSAAMAWLARRTSPAFEVQATVVAPSGAAAGAITSLATDTIDAIDLAALGNTGFAVTWQVVTGWSRGTNAALWMRRFHNAGAPSDAAVRINNRGVSMASPTTGASSSVSSKFTVAGTPEGSIVGSFYRDDAQPGVYVFGY